MSQPIFRGQLRPLALPDILRHLRGAARQGILVLTRGHDQCLLHLDGPILVDATGGDPDLCLSHRLREEGLLDDAALEQVQGRAREEGREGPALIEMEILEPAALFEWSTALVMEAATRPFAWERGEYLLLEDQGPEPGRFRQRLRSVDVAAEGLRRIRDRSLFRDCIPSGELIIDALEPDMEHDGEERSALLPHEAYVFDLLDGRRTVAEVAALSELGEFETCRTLHLLLATGHARLMLARAPAARGTDVRGLRGVLKTYNDMLTCLHQHLVREVGPIAVQIVEKCLREVRAINPALLEGVTLRPDGALTGMAVERNLRRMAPERRERCLVEGLNELLYNVLLAVKRTLGGDQEAEAVRLLRRLQPRERRLGA